VVSRKDASTFATKAALEVEVGRIAQAAHAHHEAMQRA
jgi:hypothetical protein